MKKLYIQRYTDNQRINHWLVVVVFALAGFSGLALFHPNLFLTLPLFRVALNPRFTRPFYAVPRTSAARTASG